MITEKRFSKFIVSRPVVVFMDFLVVASLTLSLVGLLEFDPFSLVEDTAELNSCDYFDRVYHRNVALPMETRVVIVATDGLSSDGIADAVNRLSAMEPASVALDLIFVNEASVTDSLLDALDRVERLILPVQLSYDEEIDSCFRGTPSLLDEYYPHAEFATISFPSRLPRQTIRRFFGEVCVGPGDSLPSLALAMARTLRPGVTCVSEPEVNFNIAEPIKLSYGELCDTSVSETVADIVRGHAVLLGDLENSYDAQPTSIDEAMPGTVLHANCAVTLLAEKTMRPLGSVWLLLVTLVFIFSIVALNVYCAEHDIAKSLGGFAIKGAFAAVILIGGYMLYTRAGIRSDFSFSIELVFFSMMVVELWMPIRTLIFRKLKIEKKDD